MKFSMIFEAQTADPGRSGERQVFDECVEQALAAENQSYNGVWAVEHTSLTMYAHMTAPESFLAFVAGATEWIEVGHGVVCLPHAMNHPIKVAERIATLDLLCRGRLMFGVGKGGTEQEAGAFGNKLEDLQDQVDEAMIGSGRRAEDQHRERTEGRTENMQKFCSVGSVFDIQGRDRAASPLKHFPPRTTANRSPR